MPGEVPTAENHTYGSRTKVLVGQNAWLVDEMYEQYKSDPQSVSASRAQLARYFRYRFSDDSFVAS